MTRFSSASRAPSQLDIDRSHKESHLPHGKRSLNANQLYKKFNLHSLNLKNFDKFNVDLAMQFLGKNPLEKEYKNQLQKAFFQNGVAGTELKEMLKNSRSFNHFSSELSKWMLNSSNAVPYRGNSAFFKTVTKAAGAYFIIKKRCRSLLTSRDRLADASRQSLQNVDWLQYGTDKLGGAIRYVLRGFNKLSSGEKTAAVLGTLGLTLLGIFWKGKSSTDADGNTTSDGGFISTVLKPFRWTAKALAYTAGYGALAVVGGYAANSIVKGASGGKIDMYRSLKGWINGSIALPQAWAKLQSDVFPGTTKTEMGHFANCFGNIAHLDFEPMARQYLNKGKPIDQFHIPGVKIDGKEMAVTWRMLDATANGGIHGLLQRHKDSGLSFGEVCASLISRKSPGLLKKLWGPKAKANLSKQNGAETITQNNLLTYQRLTPTQRHYLDINFGIGQLHTNTAKNKKLQTKVRKEIFAQLNSYFIHGRVPMKEATKLATSIAGDHRYKDFVASTLRRNIIQSLTSGNNFPEYTRKLSVYHQRIRGVEDIENRCRQEVPRGLGPSYSLTISRHLGSQMRSFLIGNLNGASLLYKSIQRLNDRGALSKNPKMQTKVTKVLNYLGGLTKNGRNKLILSDDIYKKAKALIIDSGLYRALIHGVLSYTAPAIKVLKHRILSSLGPQVSALAKSRKLDLKGNWLDNNFELRSYGFSLNISRGPNGMFLIKGKSGIFQHKNLLTAFKVANFINAARFLKLKRKGTIYLNNYKYDSDKYLIARRSFWNPLGWVTNNIKLLSPKGWNRLGLRSEQKRKELIYFLNRDKAANA